MGNIKTILGIFLITSGLVILLLSPSGVKKYEYNKRKAEIKESTLKIIGNCTSPDFEERRKCFHNKLIDLRKSNTKINIKYKMIYNETSENLISEDQDDLVKISKNSNLSFFSCLSNTFFVHWDAENIYLSLENSLGILICKDSVGKDIVIAPQDLDNETIYSVINNLKNTQIK